MRSGSDILIESLKKEGVEIIFGYPGGVLLGLYDRLFDSGLLNVLPRHEQGGAHAAEGYAKATGKVGVCLGTSGPGATNLVTGIANAYLDSTPLVVLTGQVTSSLIGGDAFQEADIVGITRPVVKHSYLVKDPADIATIVKEAFHIASTGRPGPVVIDLPKDMLAAKTVYKHQAEVALPGYQPNYEGHPMQIKKLLHNLENAERPVILVGGGVSLSYAHKNLSQFVDLTNIPVVATFMGLGALSADHPMYVGWLGMHGNYASNMAIMESDFLLAIGTRFSDRSTGTVQTFAKNAKIAQIDIDPCSIGKNIRVDTPIVGDANIVLSQMLKYIKEFRKEKQADARTSWREQIAKWEKERPFSYTQSDKIIKPQFVIEEIYRHTKGDAIICTDVGQHQMWAGQFYKFKEPRQFITSGGLGTMGYGMPAAIGAKLGMPDKEVFCITGDGSILMNIQELCTAKQYRVGIKIAILNNKFLGMVRQWQEIFFNKRYSSSCMECQPDFVEVANAFGAVGLRADKPSDIMAVLKESAKITDRPVLMDFACAREENVFPMVAAGSALNEMIYK